MTTATAAIAQHLNVAETIIASVEEWAHVLFVRFVGRRPRFVSKKVAMNTEMTKEDLIEKMEAVGATRWTKGAHDRHDRMYFHGSVVAKLLSLSNSKARQINAAKFYYDLNTSEFVQGCNTKCYDVTDRGISGIGRPQRNPYWVEAVSEAVGI